MLWPFMTAIAVWAWQRYADGVIVGSAFINKLLESEDEASGLIAVRELAEQLAQGVREGR